MRRMPLKPDDNIWKDAPRDISPHSGDKRGRGSCEGRGVNLKQSRRDYYDGVPQPSPKVKPGYQIGKDERDRSCKSARPSPPREKHVNTNANRKPAGKRSDGSRSKDLSEIINLHEDEDEVKGSSTLTKDRSSNRKKKRQSNTQPSISTAAVPKEGGGQNSPDNDSSRIDAPNHRVSWKRAEKAPVILLFSNSMFSPLLCSLPSAMLRSLCVAPVGRHGNVENMHEVVIALRKCVSLLHLIVGAET